MISYSSKHKAITFDRDHYCKNREIYEQVTKMFGSSIDPQPRWKWQQVFGYTTVEFVNIEDYKKFFKWVRANRKSLRYNGIQA